jgi:hypothetical protein
MKLGILPRRLRRLHFLPATLYAGIGIASVFISVFVAKTKTGK